MADLCTPQNTEKSAGLHYSHVRKKKNIPMYEDMNKISPKSYIADLFQRHERKYATRKNERFTYRFDLVRFFGLRTFN